MITNVKKAFDKAKEENRKTAITYIYKYMNYSNSVAIPELLSIDVVKNMFTKSTLLNYLMCMRRYVLKGQKTVGLLPPYAYEIVDELKAKHLQHLTPPENAKLRVINRKETHVESTNPITTTKVVSSSVKTYPQLLNLKSQLELETVNVINKIKQLQEKHEENTSKLKALDVVLGMLK